MSYTVLARRYRSREFDEMVGQEPIVRTLRNAVTSGRTAHAYLFCGTRGVGKTSMARLLAKALNATEGLAQRDEIAEAILRGEDIDVIEIDGASNRGVQEARDLIAASGLVPSRCPCRIYIIDEVHMLTREAFNALLKTMEEPPSHVKFILCTTEPHKVPATIQSRCQRFDFRTIPAPKIAEHLRTVLAGEGVDADDEVVHKVARLGNGSMRDALSLLDRLLAGGDQCLTVEGLDGMLGLPAQTLVDHLLEAITDGNAGDALKHAQHLLAEGVSIEQSLESLAEAFRAAMLVRTCGDDTDLVDLGTEARARAVAMAGRLDTAGFVHMIALCDAASRHARITASARALFDATIVRLAMTEQLADIPTLLAGGPVADGSGKKKGRDPIPAIKGAGPYSGAPKKSPDPFMEPEPAVVEMKLPEPAPPIPRQAQPDTREALEHPTVREAMTLFDAVLVRVEEASPAP